ncbi:hypothetical protein METBIDRAFT_31492 [Metschnikowia bicuspidata var. bicuspidata NRRL YB-4993]|uniref:Superoxide dismutase copper/zinc binding domain-containing protein n=1 Tax=Metschnikowia bicuspidata var. bicuspidata NRRL YB-4993 TaxID=869754 RepID=A0A1A0HF43_9ASCO|nr:hypothetical protein METBIDRAFT_31492 [Metschnikowia bicuspidata var. bicuspidata NRRL YB-4993]OBA22621.1 hypothetical protein METBIDRAFT_31492 [Metschnikowia bicuspidata var. bicuspidata NRRL YB-4993]
MPVPADGNCEGTLGHFNPYSGIQNAGSLAEFEVGDLSGKHGVINGSSLRESYSDQFISLNPGNRAFVGDRSIVVHYANMTRLACANIVREDLVAPVEKRQLRVRY